MQFWKQENNSVIAPTQVVCIMSRVRSSLKEALASIECNNLIIAYWAHFCKHNALHFTLDIGNHVTQFGGFFKFKVGAGKVHLAG